ncbi:hypothetical protein BKA58DRAFT_189923 [Alternaria rosae]|uniref:uncharacterized protein n=1 Tax=Alternaria rosae TaxID=1187941 RepID=UPI001E8CF037|nr:uncharacterized protein BKA58DRAFT_189923 [Alternaria rosae]KAH6868203.1 hypothetical protein BKA58DRAFT_189923 [Alternaria rosae]
MGIHQQSRRFGKGRDFERSQEKKFCPRIYASTKRTHWYRQEACVSSYPPLPSVSLAHKPTAPHTRSNRVAQQIHIFEIEHMHQDHLRTFNTFDTCGLLINHDSSRPLHHLIGSDTSKRPPCLHKSSSQDVPAGAQSRCSSVPLFRTTSFAISRLEKWSYPHPFGLVVSNRILPHGCQERLTCRDVCPLYRTQQGKRAHPRS